MALGPWQIAIVLVLVLVFFGGKGKICAIMGDMGKGITSFKKGLKDGAEDIKDAAKDPADDAIDVTPPKDDKKS